MESNIVLGYTIDALLQNFNPDRKKIMKKSSFFKLMNLIDIRLKKSGIDIKLPGYWYKYGFYIEPEFLDLTLKKEFQKTYILDNQFVLPPSKISVYKIPYEIRVLIDQEIEGVVRKYRYVKKYGELAKEDSYLLNSPYKFNTIFQDYLKIITRKERPIIPIADKLELLLDSLLSAFPEVDFSDIYDIYLNWDDTSRLIIAHVEERHQMEPINEITNVFWDLYSNGVRIKHHQNLPDEKIVNHWIQIHKENLGSINQKILKIRKKILLENYSSSEKNTEFVKELMKKAYELPSEVH